MQKKKCMHYNKSSRSIRTKKIIISTTKGRILSVSHARSMGTTQMSVNIIKTTNIREGTTVKQYKDLEKASKNSWKHRRTCATLIILRVATNTKIIIRKQKK